MKRTIAFRSSDVQRVAEHAVLTKGEVLLVKDQGLYLMSSGEPRDVIDGVTCFCAFARGCDPEKDAHWYENSRSLVGGDDFGETLTGFAPELLQQAKDGRPWVNLVVADETVALVD